MGLEAKRASARGLAAFGLLATLGFFATSCGDGRAGGGGTSFVGPDGGGFAPAVEDGTLVGYLETPLPATGSLILHGTLPVPPGTYPRPDGLAPFTVLDFDGSPRPTQTELVSRYANPEHGADVVEIVARVNADPSLPPGARSRYAVVQDPRPAPTPAPQPQITDLLDGPALVHPAVAVLLADPKAIEISATDCFGNRYVAHPLGADARLKRLRYGPAHTELRIYETMAPETVVTGPMGTLPHFLGVHAYVSTFTNEEFLGFDLRIHNGHSGNDIVSPLDDPLDKVYFERIDVRVPAGWTLLQNFKDPFFGSMTEDETGRTFALVEPNDDGSLHVIRWQGQFLRRLLLCRDEAVGVGTTRLLGAGQAFCVPDEDPGSGFETWSWWNRGTSRYFPQSYALPRLEHVGLADLRAELHQAHDELASHIEQGTDVGDYPIPSSNLGWGHPYGVPYGGMTGGNEIFRFDGISTAAAGSIRGLRQYQAVHRMHTDRQPSVLYDLDGEPSSVEAWLLEAGTEHAYVPFRHFLVPDLGSGDPFGLGQAPQFQIRYVEDNGLQPAYEADHLAYDPHDFQHFIRYTRAPKVLAWLANDSLAKDDLRMQAENFHLSYHPYFNNAYGGYQVSGMRAHLEFVKGQRRKGFPFGRGEAWGFDTAAAAYALSDPAWRARKLPWFERLVQLMVDGQGGCVGFIQAQVSNKFVDGKYRARQAIEASITENMLQGVRETVFRGADDVLDARIANVLRRSVLASVSDLAWFPGESAPWSHTGVGPKNGSANWCRRSQMPADAYTPVYERYLIWTSLAYGYELTGDPALLERARQLTDGNPDLLGFLRNQGTDNLENRAGLLALMQYLDAQAEE